MVAWKAADIYPTYYVAAAAVLSFLGLFAIAVEQIDTFIFETLDNSYRKGRRSTHVSNHG